MTALSYLTLPVALRAADHAKPDWLALLTAMFYGGIIEEILTRWGFRQSTWAVTSTNIELC